MKFHRWPWKTIGHLFNATSSFVHHFPTIGDLNWRYSPETPNLGQNRRFLEPSDLAIWRMTLKNNRAPLLWYFNLMPHFVAIGELKLELQSGNAQFGSNSTIFKDVRPWNLTDDLAKQEGTSSMLLQPLCIISYPLVNSNLSYSPETLNSGQINDFFSRVT